MSTPNIDSFKDSAATEDVESAKWTEEEQVKQLIKRGGEQIKQSYSFSPRPTDVIVAVPPKSGNTWLSHICHQIRTKGADLDFEDQIPNVVTFLELNDIVLPQFKVDPDNVIQPAEPRVFLTHFTYERVPKGGRLIYCFRNPTDLLYSLYLFIDTMWLLKGRVSLKTCLDFLGSIQFTAIYLRDLLVWWEHRHDEDVLILFFDDLLEDHMGCVRRIAKFIGAQHCDDETIARVVQTTTHAEMAKNHSKFDNHSIVKACAPSWGDSVPSKLVGRVRTDGGRSGDGQKLPVEVQQRIEKEWQDIIMPKLGFNNFQEMREAWKNERKK